MTKLTAELESKIITDFISGDSAKTITRRYGIGKTTLYRVTAKAGIERQNPLSVWPAREDEVYQLYIIETKTLDEIGEIYGVSGQQIWNVIEKYFPGFKELRNKKNAARYIRKEYLGEHSKIKMTRRQLEEVTDWLTDNKELLIGIKDVFYTSEDEDTITYFKGDYYDGKLYGTN